MLDLKHQKTLMITWMFQHQNIASHIFLKTTTVTFRVRARVFTDLICCHSDPNRDNVPRQVRRFHVEEDRSESLCPARGLSGGQPKNGDDHLRLPDGERHEEGLKETHTDTHTHTHTH